MKNTEAIFSHPSVANKEAECERLKKLLRYWQKKLRLQDWEIRVELARYFDCETLGLCNVSPELKYARIRIQDPSDDTPGSYRIPDIEEILVHEMLHIHLHQVNEDITPSETIALEQAINGIVHALISLKRKKVVD